MNQRTPKARMKLRDVFEEFYITDDLSRLTVGMYQRCLRKWEQLTDDPEVGDITDETLDQFRQA